MKFIKTPFYIFATFALLMTACGGNEENTTEEEAAETTFLRPDPITTSVGNSFEEKYESYSISSDDVSLAVLKYTLLDYTTNFATENLPIMEGFEPSNEEQLVKFQVEIELTQLQGYENKSASNSFSVLLNDGESEIDKFVFFSDEFKAEQEPKDLQQEGEKQIMDIYFTLPLNVDLSDAKFALYQGSDVDLLILNMY